MAINLSLGKNDRHDQAMISCEQSHTHKHTDAIKEIGAWVQWLKKQGATAITIAGHSRGENQAAWYAAEYNNESAIKNVVLLAPQLWSAQEEVDTYQKKYHKDLKPLLAKAQKLVDSGKGNTLMQHTDLLYCKDSNVTAASFADYYQVNPKMDTLHLLPKIQKPVLIFSATEDTVVKGLPEKLQPIMDKHSNIEGYEIQDSDHSFLDFAGEEVSEKIKQFIQ